MGSTQEQGFILVRVCDMIHLVNNSFSMCHVLGAGLVIIIGCMVFNRIVDRGCTSPYIVLKYGIQWKTLIGPSCFLV